MTLTLVPIQGNMESYTEMKERGFGLLNERSTKSPDTGLLVAPEELLPTQGALLESYIRGGTLLPDDVSISKIQKTIFGAAFKCDFGGNSTGLDSALSFHNTPIGLEFIEMAVNAGHPEWLLHEDAHGSTSFAKACSLGNSHAAKAIIKAVKDRPELYDGLFKPDESGINILHETVRAGYEDLTQSLIAILVKQHTTEKAFQASAISGTALDFAIRLERRKEIDAFIKAAVDSHIPDVLFRENAHGENSLDTAILQADVATITSLLKAAKDSNIQLDRHSLDLARKRRLDPDIVEAIQAQTNVIGSQREKPDKKGPEAGLHQG